MDLSLYNWNQLWSFCHWKTIDQLRAEPQKNDWLKRDHGTARLMLAGADVISKWKVEEKGYIL